MTRDEYLADNPPSADPMPSAIHDAQRAGAIVFTLFAPSVPIAPLAAMLRADATEHDNMAAYAASRGQTGRKGN